MKRKSEYGIMYEDRFLQHSLNSTGRMFLQVRIVLKHNCLFYDCFDLAVFMYYPAEILRGLHLRDHAMFCLVFLSQSYVVLGEGVGF